MGTLTEEPSPFVKSVPPLKIGEAAKNDPNKVSPPGKFQHNRPGPPGGFDPNTFDLSKLDLSKWADLPNPYHWPLLMRNRNISYNGATVQVGRIKVDSVARLKKIRSIPVRGDDVFLVAFPKCGAHWLSEILHMLLKGSTSYRNTNKVGAMIDFLDDLDSLETEPSPRLFNSHYPLSHLPDGIAEKNVKIVHVMRNPKDTAVSWYHHVKQMLITPPEFNFENFLKGYMQEDYTTYGHQFGYLRQMSQFEKTHPDHPIIHVYYEDLKQDAIPVVQKLGKFLGVEASESFCKEIMEACGFNKLKTADSKRNAENGTRPPINVYRKGIVGDWKNTFTVAQNEEFDEFIRQQQERGFGGFEFDGL